MRRSPSSLERTSSNSSLNMTKFKDNKRDQKKNKTSKKSKVGPKEFVELKLSKTDSDDKKYTQDKNAHKTESKSTTKKSSRQSRQKERKELTKKTPKKPSPKRPRARSADREVGHFPKEIFRDIPSNAIIKV